MAQQSPLKPSLFEETQDDDSAAAQPSVGEPSAGDDGSDPTHACDLRRQALRVLAPGGLQDAALHSACELSSSGFATCTQLGPLTGLTVQMSSSGRTNRGN